MKVVKRPVDLAGPLFKLWYTVPPATASNHRSVDVIQGFVRKFFNWPNLRKVNFRDVNTGAKDMKHLLRRCSDKLDSLSVHGGMQLQYWFGSVWKSDELREGQLRLLSNWILKSITAPRKVDFVFR